MTWAETFTADEWHRDPIGVVLRAKAAARCQGAKRWEAIVDGETVCAGRV